MNSLRCFANTACSTAAPYRCRSHFDHVANPSFALWRNFFNVALSMLYGGILQAIQLSLLRSSPHLSQCQYSVSLFILSPYGFRSRVNAVCAVMPAMVTMA